MGREGLLRLVEWAERLRARDLEGQRASRAVQARAFSPDDGGDDGFGGGAVEVPPEGTRNDVLGLLSMLLERLAVSSMPAAEGAGGRLGVIPALVPAAAASPAERLLARYREYLLVERGLAGTTAELNVRMVRPFLAGRVHPADAGAGLEHLTAGEVAAFVVTQSRQRPAGQAQP